MAGYPANSVSGSTLVKNGLITYMMVQGLSVDMAQALVDEFQTPQQLRKDVLCYKKVLLFTWQTLFKQPLMIGRVIP